MNRTGHAQPTPAAPDALTAPEAPAESPEPKRFHFRGGPDVFGDHHEAGSLDLPRPRTLNVLIILAVVALIFSYLGAYAVTNALVLAEMITPWPPGRDPRPVWMLSGFGGLLATFTLTALLFRWFSRRQLKRLDALADAEDVRFE